MKRFLIATTMLAAISAPAFADDPQVTGEDNQVPPASEMPQTTDPLTDDYILDDEDDDLDLDDELDEDESWDEAELDTPYTDDHDWIETSVYGSTGVELGEVERVRLNDMGEVDAIVVETGGVVEVGGREVLIETGEFELVVSDEDEERITLTVDAEGFAALPDFDEDLASDYPLSDDDAFDGIDEDENDIDDLDEDEIQDPSR